MLACSMPPVRSITDVPTDILRDIVQLCCGNSLYRLAALKSVSKIFRAPVDLISSSLTIVDMGIEVISGELCKRRCSDDMIRGVLEQCEKLTVLLLSSRLFQNMSDLGPVFTYKINTLCILQLHYCDLFHEVMPMLGQCLPHLQGLSLDCSRFLGAVSPWDGFPQLKLLRADWTGIPYSAIEPLRSQLLYLSCHGCSAIDDRVCEGLDSCVALDLARSPISDAGLQSLMAKGAPHLKLLLLNTKDNNLWDDGNWTTAMAEWVQQRGIRVVQSACYGTNRAAVKECLREALRDRPQVLEYAAEYML